MLYAGSKREHLKIVLKQVNTLQSYHLYFPLLTNVCVIYLEELIIKITESTVRKK